MIRLAAERLSFGYPGKPVGREVSFTLSAGEVMCLLGPNGGGKTTLFKTLLGLIPAQGGIVRYGDAPLAGLARAAVARLAGYVPQAQTGYFPFTVFDVVLMGRAAHLRPFAAPGRHDREIARAALAAIGIERLADAVYTRISGGERQMALIARALAQEPQILIMDEPTASLDFGNEVRVLERIAGLAGKGLAIVLSTHDPDQAFFVADRVAMLHEGRLARLGPPETTITPESLKLVYGVEIDVVEIAGGRRVCVPTLARHNA
ncbi:MAG: ABC transporter ATP-binding protein [Rhodospirillaceae bacterium]|nr:ABC transporter ATP-binding protein [Rhodospirillaceae bacterium]